METAIEIVYAIGFLYVFVTEFRLGERFLLSVLKSIFWFIWIFILLFHRTGNNT